MAIPTDPSKDRASIRQENVRLAYSAPRLEFPDRSSVGNVEELARLYTDRQRARGVLNDPVRFDAARLVAYTLSAPNSLDEKGVLQRDDRINRLFFGTDATRSVQPLQVIADTKLLVEAGKLSIPGANAGTWRSVTAAVAAGELNQAITTNSSVTDALKAIPREYLAESIERGRAFADAARNGVLFAAMVAEGARRLDLNLNPLG